MQQDVTEATVHATAKVVIVVKMVVAVAKTAVQMVRAPRHGQYRSHCPRLHIHDLL
jgi:hypothetical protein